MPKLTTKIDFIFDVQDEFPEFDVDMKLKTNKVNKDIKIIKKPIRKRFDPSTSKLF